MPSLRRIVPCLRFDGQAEEGAMLRLKTLDLATLRAAFEGG